MTFACVKVDIKLSAHIKSTKAKRTGIHDWKRRVRPDENKALRPAKGKSSLVIYTCPKNLQKHC